MQRPHSRALDHSLLVRARVEQDGGDNSVVLERRDVQRRPEVALFVEVRAPSNEGSDRSDVARQHRFLQIDRLRRSGAQECQERGGEQQRTLSHGAILP